MVSVYSLRNLRSSRRRWFWLRVLQLIHRYREQVESSHRSSLISDCITRLVSGFAPHTRQPGLLLTRQPGGAIVVFQLHKPGGGQQRLPGREVVIGTVARPVPAFAVVTARVAWCKIREPKQGS